MRIVPRSPKPSDNIAAAIAAGETAAPGSAILTRENGAHSRECRSRIKPVVPEAFVELDDLAESLPEFLFDRRRRDNLTVACRIQIVPGRCASDQVVRVSRPVAGRFAVAESPVHEWEQVIGHRDIEISTPSSSSSLL